MMCPNQLFYPNPQYGTFQQPKHREKSKKPEMCPKCFKRFANKSYLFQHQRIHLGIKSFACKICEKAFTQQSHLLQHTRTHTGERPYKCEYPLCDKTFAQSSNLLSHVKSHHSVFPFRCKSCNTGFSDQKSLYEHIPKHRESNYTKKHVCLICGKSYAHKKGLEKHIIQKHSEEINQMPPPLGPAPVFSHLDYQPPYTSQVPSAIVENMFSNPPPVPAQGQYKPDANPVVVEQQGMRYPLQPINNMSSCMYQNPNGYNQYNAPPMQSTSNFACQNKTTNYVTTFKPSDQLACTPNPSCIYGGYNLNTQNIPPYGLNQTLISSAGSMTSETAASNNITMPETERNLF